MAYGLQWPASVVRAGCASDAGAAPGCRQVWAGPQSWDPRLVPRDIRHDEIAPRVDVPETASGDVRNSLTRHSFTNEPRGMHTGLQFLSVLSHEFRRRNADVSRRQRIPGAFVKNRRSCASHRQEHSNDPFPDTRQHFRVAALELPSALRTTVRLG